MTKFLLENKKYIDVYIIYCKQIKKKDIQWLKPFGKVSWSLYQNFHTFDVLIAVQIVDIPPFLP